MTNVIRHQSSLRSAIIRVVAGIVVAGLINSGFAHSDVGGDVEYLTASDGGELGLRPTQLKVKTTEHSLHRTRDIVLHELSPDPLVAVPISMIALIEVTPIVGKYSRLEHEDPGKGAGDDLHRASLGVCSKLITT